MTILRKRFVVTTGVAICTVAVVTVGATSPASGSEGRKVRFTVLSPITEDQFFGAFPGDLSRCSFGTDGNVAAPCVAPVTPTEPAPGAFDAAVSGDWTGTTDFDKSAVLTAFNDLSGPLLNIPFENYVPYSVHIERCGTGTLILHTHGNLNSPDGTWEIVPDSGRGDLRGISGRGVNFDGATNSDGTTPNNFVGHVRCKRK